MADAGVVIPVNFKGLMEADARLKSAKTQFKDLEGALKRISASGSKTAPEGLIKAYERAEKNLAKEKQALKQVRDEMKRDARLQSSIQAAGKNWNRRGGDYSLNADRLGRAKEFVQRGRNIGSRVVGFLETAESQGFARATIDAAKNAGESAVALGGAAARAAGIAASGAAYAADRVYGFLDAGRIKLDRQNSLQELKTRNNNIDLSRANAQATKDAWDQKAWYGKLWTLSQGFDRHSGFQGEISAALEKRLAAVEEIGKQVKEKFELYDASGIQKLLDQSNQLVAGSAWKAGTSALSMFEQSRVARLRYAASMSQRGGSRTGD